MPSDEKGIKLSDYQKFPLIKPKIIGNAHIIIYGNVCIDVASNVNDKDFVVPFSELELGRELGRGAFGKINLSYYPKITEFVKELYIKEFGEVVLLQLVSQWICSNE